MYKLIGADGKEYGPITAEVLRQWIAEGRADARTRVIEDGGTEWKTLAETPELSGLLAAAPPSVLPSTAVPGVEEPRTNGLAAAGMIMGILAVSCAFCCHGLPFNVLGLIFSAIGLSQINQDPAGQRGRGMAIAGLILSIVSIFLAVLLLALGFALRTSDVLRHFRALAR
ncbi:MAG: DUF4190 domain-containing protein [Limisphaerales bacterium]